MASRTKATSVQLNHLFEFMKVHQDCATGRSYSLQGKVELEKMWRQLVDTLNALGGPVKSIEKWKQTWRDLRNSVKKKAIKNIEEFKEDGPEGTRNVIVKLESLSDEDEAEVSIEGPVALYGTDGSPCAMPMEDEPCIEVIVVPKPEPTERMCTLAPEICTTPEPASVPTAVSPPLVMANAHAKPRMRSRQRITARTDTLESHLLECEKKRVELQKKQIALEERRLSLKEAKVKAMERIATALENKFNT